MNVIFRTGSCLDVFGAEPDESFDAFVSDWPAGVSFMSRAWDKDHGGRDAWVKVWAEVAAMMRRKAKPGAYSLTWALPRTSHWTACALEDGGWFVQDVITHVFGQGWPKGRAALKPASEHWILARKGSGGALQIDAARVARGDSTARTAVALPFSGIGGNGDGEHRVNGGHEGGSWPPNFVLSHCPPTDGHPGCEERGVRRVASGIAIGRNVGGTKKPGLVYAGGMMNDGQDRGYATDGTETVPAFDCLAACDCGASVLAPAGGPAPRCACGRAMWWACPVAEMDAQSGQSTTPSSVTRGVGGQHGRYGPIGAMADVPCFGDSGGASRFFPRFTYQAKAAGGERHAGCDHLLWRADKRSPFGFVRVSREEWEALPEHEPTRRADGKLNGSGLAMSAEAPAAGMRASGNVHPTVKSLDLMKWLVSLVTPPGGRIGDVTCGSGGTGIATALLNIERDLRANFLGCDICPEAIEIAEARLAWWSKQTAVQGGLFGEATVIEPEARRPAKPRAERGTPPPASDPRQRDLFGGA